MVDDRAVLNMAGGEVDGDAEVQAMILPLAPLLQRLVEYPRGEGFNQTGMLGERYEQRWRHRPVGRVSPTQQSLDTGQMAICGVDDRLIREV